MNKDELKKGLNEIQNHFKNLSVEEFESNLIESGFQ